MLEGGQALCLEHRVRMWLVGGTVPMGRQCPWRIDIVSSRVTLTSYCQHTCLTSA